MKVMCKINQKEEKNTRAKTSFFKGDEAVFEEKNHAYRGSRTGNS